MMDKANPGRHYTHNVLDRPIEATLGWLEWVFNLLEALCTWF